jgi:hypothetical protein
MIFVSYLGIKKYSDVDVHVCNEESSSGVLYFVVAFFRVGGVEFIFDFARAGTVQ